MKNTSKTIEYTYAFGARMDRVEAGRQVQSLPEGMEALRVLRQVEASEPDLAITRVGILDAL